MNQEINTINSFPEAAKKLMENTAWAERLLGFLDNIKNSRGNTRVKEIRILENEILIHLNANENRELINQKVCDLNSEFVQLLKDEFPMLTKMELVFCCYLKLDLPTETIATLKGVDTASVNMTSYRIKKKITLPENIRLINYIKSIETLTK